MEAARTTPTAPAARPAAAAPHRTAWLGSDDAPPPERPPGAQPLWVPLWLSRRLVEAHRLGGQALSAAPGRGPDGSSTAFEQWALKSFAPPPTAAAEQAELGFMRALSRMRQPAQTLTAWWLHEDGDRAVWARALQQWQRGVSPEQAAWGAKLLEEARRVNRSLNHSAKAHFARKRPFAVDPRLRTAVPHPSRSSASYPSGHTARAFTDATVMSHLMPHRRAEFMRLAHQMAMARIYGGVHFPSDTVAGAWEGALVGQWVIRTMAPPPAAAATK